MSNYLFLLLVLACPLMMLWMMRGTRGGHDAKAERTSLEELRRQRKRLDLQIEEREAKEETPTPVGGSPQ